MNGQDMNLAGMSEIVFPDSVGVEDSPGGVQNGEKLRPLIFSINLFKVQDKTLKISNSKK